ncbi:MAG: hypothetical protein HY537_12270 [Deltaproteobacteria bacterium]|nr:hypothetical protein [Deltaproteobacteria bacterium]
MKNIFVLIAIAFLSVPAYSELVSLRYEPNAVIHLCPEHMLGCVEKVEVGGMSYTLDVVGAANRKELQDVLSSYKWHGVFKTEPGVLVGFVVIEKGHMPNPTLPSMVFKVITSQFIAPR